MKQIKTSGIILAAGEGLRFGKRKQFIKLDGRPIWKWSYAAAINILDEVVVAGVDFPGGKTRQESVKISLNYIKGNKIIIFDAARPLVTQEQIRKILDKLKHCVSVSFAIKPTNTIYDHGYYKRQNLQELQVPQGFQANFLRRAHKLTKQTNATDDTKLIQEIFDINPIFLKGKINLYKLTYPSDLNIIKLLIKGGKK